MGVLEAAVNENCPPPRPVGEIGLAWKVRDMDAEASAERMYCGPGFHPRVSGYPPTPTLPALGSRKRGEGVTADRIKFSDSGD
jgi:hypothetical protein